MVKQKLEGICSKSLKQLKNTWYIKLQVHPLSHTRSPADFLVITKDRRYLIECKQVDMRKNKKNTWRLNRFTQLEDMSEFGRIHYKNKPYLLICFLHKYVDKSDYYLIPVFVYKQKTKNLIKKSLRFDEFHDKFYRFKIYCSKGILYFGDALK